MQTTDLQQKNMKGALIFLVQDKESRMFPYSNANVKRSEASAEIKKIFGYGQAVRDKARMDYYRLEGDGL
ncbi:hypothetical protein C5S35_04455 [Candidatus Methanophagaceae archaeon]|nr:hypothetical protein C5S35_04455 [Methanophagales archaeon]